MARVGIWTYRDRTLTTSDLIGFGVEAIDGPIGTVDEASCEVGSGYLVVDTGSWLTGKKVMLPAGLVERVDPGNEQVVVERTRDEIEHAPALDSATYLNTDYRHLLADYYGEGGPGRRGR